MAKTKKAAMVRPVPARPDDLPLFANRELERKLINTLQLMQNTRAYTVLEYHQTWAFVHFEGELEPRTITFRTR